MYAPATSQQDERVSDGKLAHSHRDHRIRRKSPVRHRECGVSVVLSWSKSDNANRSGSQYPPLGTAASHQQNPSAAIWGSRATQQTPVQRQQHAAASQSTISQPSQSLHLQNQAQTTRDPFSNPNQFSRNLDDYRHGGQGIAGQLLGDRSQQSGSQDDYPNLGDADSADSASERRSSVMQHSSYGLLNNGLGLNQHASLRNPLSNPQSENSRITSPHTSVTGGKRSLQALAVSLIHSFNQPLDHPSLRIRTASSAKIDSLV